MANEKYTAVRALVENQWKEPLTEALADTVLDWSGDIHELELDGLVPDTKIEVTLRYRSA